MPTFGPNLDNLTKDLELRLVKALMIQEILKSQNIGSILTVKDQVVGSNTKENLDLKKANDAFADIGRIINQFGASLSDSKFTQNIRPTHIGDTQKSIAALDKDLATLRTVLKKVGKSQNTEVLSINAIVDNTYVGTTIADSMNSINDSIKTAVKKTAVKLSNSTSKVTNLTAVADEVVNLVFTPPVNPVLPSVNPLVPKVNPVTPPVNPTIDSIKQALVNNGMNIGDGTSEAKAREAAKLKQASEAKTREDEKLKQASEAKAREAAKAKEAANTINVKKSDGVDPLEMRVSALEAKQLAMQQEAERRQEEERRRAAEMRSQAPIHTTIPISSDSRPQMFIPNVELGYSPQDSSTRQQQDYDSLLHEFYKAVAKYPETQVRTINELTQQAPLVDGKEPVNYIQSLAVKLSQERKPLSDAPGFIQQPDGTYKIENSSRLQGPIFMSRIDKNTGKQIIDPNNGKPVYDVLHYEPVGVLNKEKSFIAPDGVPPGSTPTIDPHTRQEVLAVHAERANSKAIGRQQTMHGFPPEHMRKELDDLSKRVGTSINETNSNTHPFPPSTPGRKQNTLF